MPRAFVHLCLLVAAVSLPLSAASAASLARYAIIAGANYGGPDRPQLKYAESDARAFDAVLRELGGVSASNRLLLIEPDTDEVVQAFAEVALRLAADAAEGRRAEVIVYYSGHSDEQGLLLGGERFGYGELKRMIAELGADVRIAVLDSCSSGALTRAKGGVHRPPFLVDASTDLEGHAFLTSSAPDEASQESDRIGASFFTHYLVSALRGAGDSSRDGKVTLNEAYEFAFHETLARTQGTRIGAQHAAYDIRLTGTGDLVITDLRGTSAALTFDVDVAGRVFVRDQQDRLVAELRKASGDTVELALGPGDYEVTVDAGGGLAAASVTLVSGDRRTLLRADLRSTEAEVTRPRGDLPPEAAAAGVVVEPVPPEPTGSATESTAAYEVVPLGVTLFPPLSTGWFTSDRTIHIVALNLLVGGGAKVRGAELGGLINLRTEDVEGVQAAGIGNLAGGSVGGAQLAGVANVAGGRVEAAQFAGVANVAGESVRGVQWSGVTNVAGGPVTGAQGSGAVNLAAGDVRGMQLSGAVNVADGALYGGQFSVVNVAGDVRGAQIGVVNVARRVRGVQLGLVNVSEDIIGLPIGLVNVVEEGQRDVMAWASYRPVEGEDFGQQLNLGFKLGSRFVHTLVVAGTRTATFSDFEDAADDWFAGVGVGGHIPIGDFFVDIDALSGVFNPPLTDHDPLHMQSQLRLTLGYEVFDLFSLFVGAAATHEFGEPGRGVRMSCVAPGSTAYESHCVYPEVFAGVSL